MTVSPAGIRLSVWMAVFTGITTAVIALRIWAVRLTRKSLQLSDYLVIVAYVCSQFLFTISANRFRSRQTQWSH